jgi:alkylhydroperoxidase family enzyme
MRIPCSFHERERGRLQSAIPKGGGDRPYHAATAAARQAPARAVCWTDCPYVWAAHAPLARKAGVREDAIAAVRDRAALTALTPDERDVVDYVRQLLRANRVDQALFDRLTAAHGTPWLVECTALIGHYGMITAQLNAFEVAPRPAPSSCR